MSIVKPWTYNQSGNIPMVKSALKQSGSDTSHAATTEHKVTKSAIKTSPLPTQFRIIVGSYEHNLLCLSLILHKTQPVFQPIFHFEAHTLSIKCIDLAKRYLVTGSNDEHIRIYDLQKRKELGTLLDHQGTVTTLKFSEEDSIASSTALGVEKSTEKSGKWLLSGSEDGKIIIWRTKDWEPFGVLKGHLDRVNDVAIHPSGRVAILVSKDQTIRLWNLMTAKKAAILKIKGRDHLGQCGEFVRWTKDAKHFIVGLHNLLLIYTTDNAKIYKKVKFESTLMCVEVVTVDGQDWLIAGLGNGKINVYDMNATILAPPQSNEQDEDKIWETKPESVESLFVLMGHTNRIKALLFFQHPTATRSVPYLVLVSSDGKIVVWDLRATSRDQVAVYDTGERLNCVVACPEQVEKLDTMKRRLEEGDGELDDAASGSEYETDGEEIKSIMTGGHLKKAKKGKKSKKGKNSKISVTLE